MEMTKEAGAIHELNLHPLFTFKFANHPAIQAMIDECKVVPLLYNDETLYGIAGIVSLTVFEIAMSLGGSEAIVERFYSEIDTQLKVRQQHTTLEDCTILDW